MNVSGILLLTAGGSEVPMRLTQDSTWQLKNLALMDFEDQAGAHLSPSVGLIEFTGRPDDMGKFKAPTLRNIAVTEPYMRGGSISALDEALDHCAAGGRTIAGGPTAGDGSANPLEDGLVPGFTLTSRERADLLAFLESLTDETFLTDARFANPWPAGSPAKP